MGLAGVFLSHYRRHPGQLAGLLLILICAAALWSGVRSLTLGAADAVAQSRALLEPRFLAERLDGRPVGVEDFVRLRRAGLCATPRLEVEPAAGAPRILGIDPFTAGCLRQYGSGAPAVELLLAEPDRPLLLGGAEDLARWRPPSGFETREVAGLPAGLLLADIAVADGLRPQGRARLEILLPGGAASRLPPGYRLQVDDYGVEPDPLVDAFLLSLDALAALALLVAALLLRSVQRFALEQRRRSLAILSKLGVPLRRLRLMLGAEVLLLALAGSLAGVSLGAWLAAWLQDGFEGTLDNLFSVEGLSGAAPLLSVWPGVLLLLLLLGAWAAFDLLRRPLGDERAVTDGWAGRAGWAGAALLGLSLPGLALAQGLGAIFVATSAALFGAGLLLPELLGLLLVRLQARSRNPLREWSCSEMAALCRRLRLPLMALAFAIAASVGVQAMVASFEASFSRWLDQRLQGDLYVDPGRPQAPADWAARLQALPGVTAVLPMVRGRGLADGHPVDVLGVAPGSPLLAGWRFLDGAAAPWPSLTSGGVLINEQLARRRDLAPGDLVELRFGTRHQRRRVLSVYADYGRPDGEVLVPADALPASLPQRYTTFVLGVDGTGWRDWPERHPWLAGSRLRDQATLRQGARDAFERTFRLTRTLDGLTLLLAGAALALMALAMLRLRRPIYSLLFACGVPRAALRRRLVVHAMLTTGLLSLLATPLGLFLGWVLVAKVNPAAFGWALPLGLYPGFWAQVWLAGLSIGALVGLVQGDPVRLEALKHE